MNVFYSFQSCGNTWCCLFFKYGFYLRCELQCRWFLNEYVTSIARIIQMVASLSTQRKDCRNAACPTTSHTQTGLGLKLDLRLDTLTTNLLRHDTSSSLWRYHYLLTRIKWFLFQQFGLDSQYFQCWSKQWPNWMRVFFFSSLTQFQRQDLMLQLDRSVPHTSQFIIH